ncbi:MAG: metallophosphoesterase family protein [Thermodesulfobacteriota bacterium]
MQIAVISDIHSNLEALTAVLDRIDSFGVDTILCLGDIVGYNADPDRCVEIVREREIQCVLGNHDSWVCGLEGLDNINYPVRRTILWSREQLSPKNLDFLKRLPRKLSMDIGALAIHGWVNNTDRYIITTGDALINSELLAQEPHSPRLCFFGHTHKPIAYSTTESAVLVHRDELLILKEGRRHIINPGSVGQPRDFDNRGAFLIYDSEAGALRFHRVEYNIDATCRKIIAAGLPATFAERLKTGC